MADGLVPSETAQRRLEFLDVYTRTNVIDVSDLLERIVSRASKTPQSTPTQAAEISKKNLEVLSRRFPEIAKQLSNDSPLTNNITTKLTPDGPVLFLDSVCLDHGEKPIRAAQQWTARTLTEARLKKASQLVIFGFGSGYHVESTLAAAENARVSVIEPRLEVLASALLNRDLSSTLEQIEMLVIGSTLPSGMTAGELLVRPQTQSASGQQYEEIRRAFYAARGTRDLHPTFAVLGPLMGGTLPIATYTSRALALSKQRIRHWDMSGFAPGLNEFEKFTKDKLRQQKLSSLYVEMISEVILETATEKPIDILICMAQAPVSPRVLLELRKMGVITVLWFQEDYLRFTYWKDTAKFFDFVFTIQKGKAIEEIKAAGATEVHYLPMACDPYLHAPVTLTPEEKKRWGSPISFVGAGYHNRQQVFATMSELPFKLWGTEWPTCKPFDRMVQEGGRRLTPEEYTKIFAATEINLNLHSSNERDGIDPTGDFVNPRLFELAACGAFQLVDERTHLPELLEPGKEVVTFSTTTEMREKIQYYLAHPEERKKITDAARERVLRDHTYERRLEQMMSVIYSARYETLKARLLANPWSKMLQSSEKYPDLNERCKRAFERGEDANLDGLVSDIVAGKGTLTETEKKLLFLYHVRRQIIRMRQEETGQKKTA